MDDELFELLQPDRELDNLLQWDDETEELLREYGCGKMLDFVWRVAISNARRRRGCAVEGCEGEHRAHGYCAKHLRRIERHGDHSIVLKPGPKRRV